MGHNSIKSNYNSGRSQQSNLKADSPNLITTQNKLKTFDTVKMALTQWLGLGKCLLHSSLILNSEMLIWPILGVCDLLIRFFFIPPSLQTGSGQVTKVTQHMQ